MDEAGFRIGDKVFPFASAPKIGDAPLIEAVTGLRFEEWAERLDGLTQEKPDTTAMLGLMAISVRAAEPTWTREKIVQFLGEVDFEGLDFQAAKEEALPPAEAPETGQHNKSPSDGSSTDSTTSQEAIQGVHV